MAPEEKKTLDRKLEGQERQKEEDELRERVTDLTGALDDPDLDEETREYLQNELDALKDSLEASENGGDWFKESE